MSTKVEIWSMASVEIGAGEISSDEATTTNAVACRARWDTLYEARISAHRWIFAKGKVSLSKLTAAPLNEWSVAYQLPSDYVKIIGLYSPQPYQVYEDKLYCNDSAGIDLDYLFLPGVGDCPEYFVNAIVLDLAATIAFPVTRDTALRQELRQAAAMEWRVARAIDSQERPTEPVRSQPILTARNV